MMWIRYPRSEFRTLEQNLRSETRKQGVCWNLLTNSFRRNRVKCDVDTLSAFGIPNVRAKSAFGNTKRDFS